MKPIHLAYVLTRLCAKYLFQILSPNLSESRFVYLENSVDPDQPASSIRICTVFQAVCAMLNNLERSNCNHLLKIASYGNFNLLFEKKLLAFSKC